MNRTVVLDLHDLHRVHVHQRHDALDRARVAVVIGVRADPGERADQAALPLMRMP